MTTSTHTPTANPDSTARTIAQRLRAAAVSALLAVAAMLGLALATASPASAATTRSVTVCLQDQSLRPNGYVTAQWYSMGLNSQNSGLVNESQGSLRTGCTTVYLHHTGYYRLYLNSAIVGSCATNWYHGSTRPFIQQSQPVSQRVTYSTIPFASQSAWYC